MLTSLLSRSITVDTTNPVTLTVLFEQADGTWQDISTDLMSGTTKRGKTRELDAFTAGTCQLTLRNDNRQYDPNNTASPYNGSILPMRRMQVMATVSNVLYKVFTGYVDSWQQVYTGPHSARCVVSLTDAFKVLAKALLPSSAYAKEVIADAPLHWWRLGEAAGSSVARDSIGSTHLTTASGAPTFGLTGLPINDTDRALGINSNGDGMSSPAAGSLFVTQPPFTVEVVVQPKSFVCAIGAATTSAGIYFIHFNTPGTGMWLGFGANAGTPKFTIATTSNVVGTSITSSTAMTLDQTYHIAGVCDASGNMTLYLNGVSVATGTVVIAPFAAGTAATLVGGTGVNPIVSGFTSTFGGIGVIDEAAFYTSALSATRIAAHSSAALTGWSGDSPATRYGRILDAINQPAVDRVLSTGLSVLQSAKLGQTAQEHLQGVADAEFGKFYINVHGAVVLESRDDGIDQPTLGAFVDARNGSTNVVQVATPEYTDQLIRNDVTIQRDGGIAEHVQDATSVGLYLIQSYSKTGMYHNSDDTSVGAALWIMTNYKNPLQRISQMTIKPREDAVNLFPQAVGRELTDWISVTYTPQGVGSAFAQTTVIEGIQHDFSPKDWTTTFSLSPADTNAYWQLGVSGFGELGTHTRLFF